MFCDVVELEFTGEDVDIKVEITNGAYYANSTLAPGEPVVRWCGSEQQRRHFKRSGDHNCELKLVHSEWMVVPIIWIPGGYPLTLSYGAEKSVK